MTAMDLGCHPCEILLNGRTDQGIQRFAAVPLQTGSFWFATTDHTIGTLADLRLRIAGLRCLHPSLHAQMLDMVDETLSEDAPSPTVSAKLAADVASTGMLSGAGATNQTDPTPYGKGLPETVWNLVLPVHPPLPAWQSGGAPMALIGDAGHLLPPNLAQGM